MLDETMSGEARRETQLALLERVLVSSAFQKSARARDFLRYVVEHSIANPGVEIREQEIASRLFSRDPASQGGDDTLVRVHASQVRKRLEQYFSGEGASEPLIIEIPKGNYAPLFRERRQAQPQEEQATQLRKRKMRPQPLLYWVGAALLLVLSVTFLALRRQSPSPSGSQPYSALLWSQLFRPGQRTQLVLADAGLSVFSDMVGTTLTPTEYGNRAWQTHAGRLDTSLRPWAERFMNRQLTSFADARLAHRVLQHDRGGSGVVVFSREFSPRALQTDNAVFIGSKRSNPWVALLETPLNFRFVYDEGGSALTIENRSPSPGEAARYKPTTSIERSEGYCLVAFLPNSARTGSVLILSGTEMEATEAGGEFVTNEAHLRDLHSRLKLKRRETFPWFEVLLRAQRAAGTSSSFTVAGYRRVSF